MDFEPPDWLQHLINGQAPQQAVGLRPLPSINEPDNSETNDAGLQYHDEDAIDPLQVVPPTLNQDASRLSVSHHSRTSNPSSPSNWDTSSFGQQSISNDTRPSSSFPVHTVQENIVERKQRRVVVKPSGDRLVHRRLRGIHLSVRCLDYSTN